MKRLTLIIALTLALGAALPTLPAASAPRAGVSRHVLENGLTVIVRENPSSDLVVTEAMVRAGPRFEDARQSGISFFMRAMMVRGTQKRTAAEIAQGIESIGGQLGGGTGTDFVSVYTITPTRHVDAGMDLIADLLTNARFDPQDVETQRRVSLSRISQNADQPLQRAIELLYDSLYPYHPYSGATLGTAESVSALARDQLVEFYQAHATAPNMIVIVAGNITEAQALEKVKKAFAGLRTSPAPRKTRLLRVVERALAPRPAAPQEVRETRSIAAAWIAIGYLGVPAGHRDFAALRVANAVLGEGMSSRLFIEIRDKRGLAYQVGSSLVSRAGPGSVLMVAGTDPPNMSAVVSGMLREVERLRGEAVSAEEVERAKRGVIGRFALAHEQLEQQAFYLGWYEIMGVGFDYDERFPQEIAQVSPADVHRVARLYLTNHVLAIVAPPTAR
ncbi:MAG: M16 family metallopeptidase [Armatimonadota bacterium]